MIIDNNVLSLDGVNEIKNELNLIFDENGKSVEIIKNDKINGLIIDSDGTKVTVNISKNVFLYRALSLISQQKSNVFYIKEDANFDTNGIMIDCSRNAVLNVDTLKWIIRILAKMGLDTIFLYMEDTYEIEDEPYFGYMRGRYSKKELKEIDDYAYSFGIEIIPCIQTLSHLGVILKWGVYSSIKDFGEILLADDDKTYNLIEKMISTCKDTFRTSRIHIGMDEADMLGRGKYYDIHGDVDKFRIMCDHLKRVSGICGKYQLKPMIWSDMFFRLANDGDYRGYNPVPDYVSQEIPGNVSLVYWEYLRDDPNQYDILMKNHTSICEHTVFAGGAWKWMSFLPSLTPSINRTKMALNLCKKNGIKESFSTAWGDDGCDASIMSVLPVFQVQAEMSFYENPSEEWISERLSACTGYTLSDFMTLDMPELEKDKNNGLINPNKYILYQDLFTGLFDLHIPDEFREKYRISAQASKIIANKNDSFSYLFANASALYDVLEIKSYIGKDIRKLYLDGDKDNLKIISNEVLPDLISKVEKFHNSLQSQWFTENKTFGFEVQDQRLGGLVMRIKSVKNRIDSYVNGEILSIPELEEKKLPFSGKADELTFCNNWKSIVTTSWI